MTIEEAVAHVMGWWIAVGGDQRIFDAVMMVDAAYAAECGHCGNHSSCQNIIAYNIVSSHSDKVLVKRLMQEHLDRENAKRRQKV
jgi:hypothetical protein